MNHAVMDFLERNHARPLLILGDMAELGEVSEKAHQNLVEMVMQHDVQPLDRWKVVWGNPCARHLSNIGGISKNATMC